MAGPIGFWDKSGVPDGWFSDLSQSVGWWDEDLLDQAGPTAYSLSCSAGSYALTGQAVAFSVGHTLSASAGSYSLTGQAATLTKTGVVAYTLTADAGAYALTGYAALLQYSSASQPADTHDGADERKRVQRKRRDRESLREQLEAAFSPSELAQDMREALVPGQTIRLALGKPARADRKPDNLAAIIEAGTNIDLLEQDDEEAIIALLGAF